MEHDQCEPGDSVRPKRKQRRTLMTPEQRKETARLANLGVKRKRVFIGAQIVRWNAAKAQLGFRSNPDLAAYFLDRFYGESYLGQDGTVHQIQNDERFNQDHTDIDPANETVPVENATIDHTYSYPEHHQTLKMLCYDDNETDAASANCNNVRQHHVSEMEVSTVAPSVSDMVVRHDPSDKNSNNVDETESVDVQLKTQLNRVKVEPDSDPEYRMLLPGPGPLDMHCCEGGRETDMNSGDLDGKLEYSSLQVKSEDFDINNDITYVGNTRNNPDFQVNVLTGCASHTTKDTDNYQSYILNDGKNSKVPLMYRKFLQVIFEPFTLSSMRDNSELRTLATTLEGSSNDIGTQCQPKTCSCEDKEFCMHLPADDRLVDKVGLLGKTAMVEGAKTVAKYRCTACGLVLQNLLQMKRHIRQKEIVDIRLCHLCGESFSSVNDLILHEKQHYKRRVVKSNFYSACEYDLGSGASDTDSDSERIVIQVKPKKTEVTEQIRVPGKEKANRKKNRRKRIKTTKQTIDNVDKGDLPDKTRDKTRDKTKSKGKKIVRRRNKPRNPRRVFIRENFYILNDGKNSICALKFRKYIEVVSEPCESSIQNSDIKDTQSAATTPACESSTSVAIEELQTESGQNEMESGDQLPEDEKLLNEDESSISKSTVTKMVGKAVPNVEMSSTSVSIDELQTESGKTEMESGDQLPEDEELLNEDESSISKSTVTKMVGKAVPNVEMSPTSVSINELQTESGQNEMESGDQLPENEKLLNEDESSISKSTVTKRVGKAVPNVKYRCLACGITTVSLNFLKNHITRTEIFDPKVCRYCGEMLNNEHTLLKHESRKHNKESVVKTKSYLSCTYDGCSRQFLRPTALERHISAVHLNERNFACSWADCEKRFNSPHALEVHMRIHTDSKPLICYLCGYQCRQKASLNWHMKTKHPDDALPKVYSQEGPASGLYVRT